MTKRRFASPWWLLFGMPLLAGCGVSGHVSLGPSSQPSSSAPATVTVTASATPSEPPQPSSSEPVTAAPSAAPPSAAPSVEPSWSAAQWAQLLTPTESSVVRITTYTSDLGGGVISGSGFFEDGYIVTCYHVIDSAHLFIDVWLRGASEPLHAMVAAADQAQDLALLQLDNGMANGSLPLGHVGNQAIGEPVAAVGHPGGGSLYITPGTLTSTSATISVNDYGTLSPMLEMNLAAIGGDSGGPVFDTNGHVIGVLEDGAVGVAADGGAVPVSAVRAFLAQNAPSPSAGG